MKWMLITHDYPPKQGGVARYLEALVLTCPCINLYVLSEFPGRISLFLIVYRSMKRFDGIITSHVLPIGTMCWLASQFIKKPYIIILHGMDFDLARKNFLKKYLLKKILSNADTIVVNSIALDKEVSTFTKRVDVQVVYPTISDAFLESSSFINSKHNTDNIVKLLTVGRLVGRKGHIRVLEFIKSNPGFTYTIVGNGPMKAVIEEYIKDNNIEDRVFVMPNINDRKLPDIYAKSDIFVMPTIKSETDREGFGIVYLEAQLFKLPVIATNHPGVDESIIDGETGYLINESEASLKNAIENLQDPAVRKKMGELGNRFVKDNFTRQKQFSKFCKTLECE